ncbi:MAG: hypothetical protein H6509_07510 [Bryobacterales bacterium]|nr:hypothetical protein [Acidobacteriota bacterium]MCB9384445.1 hypothetical protein [Bryobacterales bacterium]
MKKLTWFTTIALAGSLWGCGACIPSLPDLGQKDDDEVTSEGVDVEKNPLGALGALGSLGGELEKLQKDLEDMPEVDAVSFNELIAALPDPPSGWEAEDAKGETNQMGDFKMSSASRVYTKGEQRVEVKITDWAFRRMLYLPFIMSSKFSQESTEGYNKGITVGEDSPGREEHNTKRMEGKRQVLLDKRYMIEIDQRGGGPEVYDEWYGLIKKDVLPKVE